MRKPILLQKVQYKEKEKNRQLEFINSCKSRAKKDPISQDYGIKVAHNIE